MKLPPMKLAGNRVNDCSLKPTLSCYVNSDRNNFSEVVKENSRKGFTILEIIIALIIVSVAITAFIKLLGNSTLLRSKLHDHDERFDVAITKTEQAFLGLLDSGSAKGGDKNTWQGITLDKGIEWRVEEEKDDSTEGGNKDVYFYTVFVDGIELSSVVLR